jgi:serine/threonine protein kinase
LAKHPLRDILPATICLTYHLSNNKDATMPGLEGISLGRYRLKQRLGRGGMAEVYLAADERMQREVAIKIVSSSHAEFAERFSREAQAMGQLHYEHLLPAYDYGEQEPWHYLVMPYIAHGTLSDLLTHGPLALSHAAELLQQVARALHYAHQRGLIHRDIKPSNILLRDDHYAYLADFGLARALEGGGDLTQTGMLLGTPEYMAPELAEGPAGKSSDIYALAIVLYQMVSGRVPFHGDTAISTFWKHMREFPRSPSRLNALVPGQIDHVLLRALDKDPQKRYPTAIALSQAYQDALHAPQEMPSLYETEILDTGAAQPARLPGPPGRARSTPAAPDMLFLPGQPESQTPVGRRHTHPPITPARQHFEQTTDTIKPAQAVRPSRPPRQRRRSNRILVGGLMGVILLLIASITLGYFAIQNQQHTSASSTATAHAGATGTLVASQTQHVISLQQTATAVATSARTAQKNAEATATTITAGPPLLSDPLNNPDANTWPNDGTNCSFTNNAYFVTASGTNTLQPCLSGNLHYGDAAIEVDVTLISSADAGLLLRASADGNQFYDFEITSQNQFFLRYRNNNRYTFLIPNTASSAIQGVGSKNTLLVIASGSHFQLFINGTFVDAADDSTFASGQPGMAAGSLSASNGDASFTNLRVYTSG